jgi:hypothetical protein
MSNPIAEIIDTFFNGRPAPRDPEPTGPAVVLPDSIDNLVRRGPFRVRVNGKLYRITVEPVKK